MSDSKRVAPRITQRGMAKLLETVRSEGKEEDFYNYVSKYGKSFVLEMTDRGLAYRISKKTFASMQKFFREKEDFHKYKIVSSFVKFNPDDDEDLDPYDPDI